jgi:hypothetical protein
MICAFAHTVSAQTEWMNNYPSVALGDQVKPHLARPSRDDITIMVFESNESGAWKVIAQGIDNANGLPLWDALDGVVVCSANGDQRNPRAAYDSLGHVLIVWEDYRSGDEPSIYVQCLNVSDGRVAAGWPDEGVAVCDLASAADQPRIAGSVDGAYIAWRDWRNSSSSVPNRDMYVSYIMSLTADIPQGGAYQWVGDGLRVPFPGQQDCDQSEPDIAREYMWTTTPDNIERDGAILVYQDRRHISATTGDSIYNVYATRFDALGNTPWSDVRCASHDEEQLYPRLVVEGRRRGVGDSTAIIAWQDAREDAWGPVYDIYGAVLNRHDGAVIVAAGGFAICDHPGTQRYPDLALYEEDEDPQISKPYLSRVTCAWEDLRDVQSRGVDVYCAVLDGTSGAHANPSGAAGEELSTRVGDQTQVRVDHFPDDVNAYFVWTEWNNEAGMADHSDVWYQGLQVKTMQFHRSYGSGFEVAVAKGDQCTPQAGGNVFVFADKRRQSILYDALEDWNIYAETPGDCVGPREMKWRDMFADVRQSSDAKDHHFVVDAANNTLLVWQKTAGDPDDADVYIQKLDVDGVPRWTNSGIKLNTMPGASHARVCISDSSGGAQVAWQQPDDNGDPEVWYARLSPMGAFTLGPLQVTTTGHTNLYKPEIAYAWRSGNNNNGTGLVKAVIAAINTDYPGIPYVYSSPDGGDWPDPQRGLDLGVEIQNYTFDASEDADVLLAAWNESSPGGPATFRIYWGTRFQVVLDDSDPLNLDSFGGCDVAVDIHGAPPYRGGITVYSADTGNGTLNLIARASRFGLWIVSPAYALTDAAAGEGARNPSIYPDSSVNPTGWGGMLVAWDWMYEDTSVTPPRSSHIIQTNKLEYLESINLVSILRWVWPIIDVNPMQPSTQAYSPDIARIRSQGDGLDTLGFIVWEDALELCSPSRPGEIYGNWVVYDTLPPTPHQRGAQWGAAKQIGPGAGNYSQTQPMVHTSLGRSVNVYWLDGRGASDLVMGTRVWAEGADAIFWGKEAERGLPPSPDLVHFGEVWPNPLLLRSGALSHIALDVTTESVARLSVHDILGREVAVVHEGPLPAGRRVLRFDATGLRPGMYRYILRGEGALATRGLVILR